MMILRELPFVRLLIPFTLGLALEPWVGAPDHLFFGFGGLLLLLGPLGLVLRRAWQFDRRHWPGLFSGAYLVAAGLIWPDLSGDQASPLFVGRREWEGPVKIAGVVRSVDDRGKYLRLEMSLRAMKREGERVEPAVGVLLIYLPADAAAPGRPGWGDTLLLRGRLRELAGPANPEAFDFRSFLAGRGIFHQVFADTGAWKLRTWEPATAPEFIAAGAGRFRIRVLDILGRHLPDPDQRSIAAALLIGSREAIAPDLKRAYAASGAIHVLAVSGLHVGIVYMGLAFLMGMLPFRGRRWRWLRGFLLLGGVWGFVGLAGAPPSAVRAGCMFSLFILGRSLYRSSNIFNTIAASAFVTLCLDPALLRNVGFQLSYTAVAGIVYFQPLLYRWWYCLWRPGDYLWKLLTVAIAAQLGTFPLSFYYFHQFPVFFWLSGWVAVPAATLILGGGLSLLALDPVPFLGVATGKLLAGVVGMLNTVIRQIESLPGGLIEGVWLEMPGVWCCYCWVMALAWLIRRPGAGRWRLLLAITALGLALRAGQHWVWCRQQQFLVYQVAGNTLVDFIAGRTCYTLAGNGLDSVDQTWAARNYRWSRGIDHQYLLPADTVGRTGPLLRAGGLTCFAGRSFFIFDGEREKDRPPPDVDYLLVRNNPPVSWWKTSGIERIGMVIIDSSNTWQQARAWEKAASRKEVGCWNIRRDGAFVIDLP